MNGIASVPIIDVSPLRDGTGGAGVAAQVDAACRDTGFFYVVGHGIPLSVQARVDAAARDFFALDDEEKAAIAMANGGRAWRGWFPLGGELTSGRPDMKEGLYFGEELPPGDPRPLHGPNQFPARPAELRAAVLDYIGALTALGHLVLQAMAVGLGLDAGWFAEHLTARPTVLFRIFRYPPLQSADDRWSVGEHTDYGLVTLLGQDASGGLEVRGPDGWIAAPPVPDSFVVNLGDMLERMTGGRYRSTPHRVRNVYGVERLSFPLFLDPGWDAEVRPVPGMEVDVTGAGDSADRWDGASVHDWSGTYGDYLLAKVGRVFPALRDEVLGGA